MAGKIQTQQFTTAHSLYTLYETLPDETQQIFLQELLTKQAEKIAFCSTYKKAEKENDFLTDDQSHFQDLFGLLTASKAHRLRICSSLFYSGQRKILMIAVDTNVLVRVLVNDPGADDQCRLARNLINSYSGFQRLFWQKLSGF